MKYNEYSHRHGRELVEILHPDRYKETSKMLQELEPYPHGTKKGKTARSYLIPRFERKGWEKHVSIDLGSDLSDNITLAHWRNALEMEFSKFEMFYRDFFKLTMLYKKDIIDIGIIITLDDMAYERWPGDTKPYGAARASLQKLIDLLKSDYGSIVAVPLWCIGIE